jgi:hypothetical protein
MRSHLLLAAAITLASTFATLGHAAVLTVQATDNIYGAGQSSPPGGGTLPGSIAVTPGQSLTITSTGSISYNGGGNYNDPDGIGSASGEGINATNGFSGITNDHAGVLLGLFVGATLPVDNSNPPPTLTYTDATTNFASASPLLNQVFLIGDGLTGDGTGATQTFIVPANATQLYFGFADAGGYYGNPSSYDDNLGSFSTTVTGTPEPASLGILAVVGLPLLAKRRRSRA